MKQRINFLGIEIDPLTMEETLDRVSEIVDKREITQHVVINVAKLVYTQKDAKLKNIINSCGLINVDGAGVILGAKFLGIKFPERVTGIDLMQNLVAYSSEKEYKIYFLGAKEEVVSKIVNDYKKIYPNLNIAGYRNGYFSSEEEDKVAEDIKNSGADILFVAMGSPKKEIFINKFIQKMQVPFVMGVGGSFDVVSGKIKRAPLWMQKLYLEWFFRLIQEPKRMWKRYLVTNTKFAFLLLKEFLAYVMYPIRLVLNNDG